MITTILILLFGVIVVGLIWAAEEITKIDPRDED